MVKRHRKKPAIACEEKKKREWGECSIGMDGLGAHAPKRRRGERQGPGTHAPGSFSLYL
jgi:hypothetical protein